MSGHYLVSETSFGNWAEVGTGDFPKARMVRTGRYKYIAFDQGRRREQLIDMANDPGEMVNLAGRPECEAVLDQHRRYLVDWCRRTNDAFDRPGT